MVVHLGRSHTIRVAAALSGSQRGRVAAAGIVLGSVVVRAAHVITAAAAHQLATAALQARGAVRTPQAGMFRSAIASRVWKRIFCGVLFSAESRRAESGRAESGSGKSRRHVGQRTPSPAFDSSAIDTHLIKCIVRQNHR
jgi:hypothetical protein